MRIYDGRLGRFLSLDPLSETFTSVSPYSYAQNDPINYEDIYGLGPGSRAPSRTTKTNPKVNVPIDKDLLSGKSGGSIEPVSINNSPSTPPYGGAYQLESGGWYVETANGGYIRYNDNPFGPQPKVPTPDFRPQAEKDIEEAKSAFYYFRRDINAETLTHGKIVNTYTILSPDPSNLPDWYLNDVKKRLLGGNPTVSDQNLKDELVRRGQLSSKFGMSKKFSQVASGTTLGENMERAGRVRPHFDHAAHHIVAGTAKGAREAQRILKNAGIDINDADNGVYLPTTNHRGLHTKDYYRKINSRLSGATQGNIRQELRKIGDEIKNGKF